MSALKDVRVVSLIIIVVASLGMIAAPSFVKTSSATVDVISPNATCGVKQGDTVNQIDSVVVNSQSTFDQALGLVRKGVRSDMVVNGLPLGCMPVADGDIGFTVKGNSLKTLNFGIDIEGGTRVILSPTQTITKDQLDETVKTLEDRINFYGLKEVKVTTLGDNLVQMEMSGATGDDIRNFLSKQGKFSGKISYSVPLVNGSGVLRFSNGTHSVLLRGPLVSVDGAAHAVNQTFLLNNETFQAVSATNTSAVFWADLFTDKNVKVTPSSQDTVTQVDKNTYQFTFGIQVDSDGAKKFAKLTANQPIVTTSGTDSYIGPQMVLLLDDNMITQLNIASTLAGQVVNTASISGTDSTFDLASQEKLRLQSTIRSGSLPVKMEIAKVDTITQTSGQDLINSTIFVAIGSIIAVSAIVFYRYRDYKIVVPMVLISLSEIVIVVGMATSQILAGVVILAAVAIGIWKREVMGVIGWITLFVMVLAAAAVVVSPWTIDIPVIAGLIAILGTGVNQMIIMTDQLFREKGKSLQERHRSAMHIIWSSAAIVVFAMIPLILGGIGSLKGFAIATIVGVLIGILITRPAYVAIIEKAKRIKLESL